MEKKVAQVDLVARVDGLEELGGAIEEVAGHLNAALELMRGLEGGYAVHVELATVPRPAGGTTSRNAGRPGRDGIRFDWRSP